MKFKIIITGLTVLSISCENKSGNVQSEGNFNQIDTSSVTEIDSNYEMKKKSHNVDSVSYSFVLSCGSGCALTYDLRNKNHINNNELELKFHITMFVNEQVAEEYFELYKIKHSDRNIVEIYSIDNKKNLLEEDSPNLFFEIKKLSETVIGSD